MTWLGQLVPGITPELEVAIFVYFLPILLVISVAVLLIGIGIMPKSAWVRFKAKLRRSGVLVSLFTDEGFERTEIMRSDLGQGILSGNPVSYIFTPRPPVVTKRGKELIDLNMSDDQERALSEALSHRLFSDTGKPLFLGYVGKSAAVTPKLLEIIKKTSRKKNPEIKTLTLLDPRQLKLYIGKTFSRSLIESIKFENERKGYLRRPVKDFVSRMKLPIGIILIIAVLAFVLLSGGIDLSGILGIGG